MDSRPDKNENDIFEVDSIRSTMSSNLMVAEKIHNYEIMAEQVLSYFLPGTSRRKMLQFLVIFEFGKLVFKMKALYAKDSGILSYDGNDRMQQIMKERDEIIDVKRQEILDLDKRTQSQSAANMSRADVIKRIEKILGVKKVEVKEEKPAEEKEGEGDNDGISKPGEEMLAICAQNQDTRELEPVAEEEEEDENEANLKKEDSAKKYKYVKSNYSRLDKLKFNVEYEQQLPRTKSSLPFIRTLPVRNELLKSKSIPLRVKISEILRIFRPVIHCLAIIMYKKPKFRTILLSLGLDILILILRIGYQGKTREETKELKRRNFRLLFIYFFRQPIWQLFTKPLIVEPILNKFVKIEFVKNLILQALEFRSSFSMSL